MKQTIEIEVPEGKKAVWKDGKVVFEDIMPELPKSWEEFCMKYREAKNEYYIRQDSEIICSSFVRRDIIEERNLLPTKEDAEAHLALMQLHQLRDCYRQGWKPDWSNINQDKYYITHIESLSLKIYKGNFMRFLSFPMKEIAENFLCNFENLIRKAGDLI